MKKGLAYDLAFCLRIYNTVFSVTSNECLSLFVIYLKIMLEFTDTIGRL